MAPPPLIVLSGPDPTTPPRLDHERALVLLREILCGAPAPAAPVHNVAGVSHHRTLSMDRTPAVIRALKDEGIIGVT